MLSSSSVDPCVDSDWKPRRNSSLGYRFRVEIPPPRAIDLCKAAHERLLITVRAITDEGLAQPSLLPGWTVGHVMAHIARNAEGHTGRLTGALEGREVARYPGGQAQRNRDIEVGARHSAERLKKDIADSIRTLEDVWARSEHAGWPNATLMAGDNYPTSESPLRRLREVEVHHVDLAQGYGPENWPDDYVGWDLAWTLERLPARILKRSDRKRLLAWLIGRADPPGPIELKPWL